MTTHDHHDNFSIAISIILIHHDECHQPKCSARTEAAKAVPSGVGIGQWDQASEHCCTPQGYVPEPDNVLEQSAEAVLMAVAERVQVQSSRVRRLRRRRSLCFLCRRSSRISSKSRSRTTCYLYSLLRHAQ